MKEDNQIEDNQMDQDEAKRIVTSAYENIKKPKVVYSVRPDYTKGVAVRELSKKSEEKKKKEKKKKPKKSYWTKLKKRLQKKVVSKRVLKRSRASYTVPNVHPAPYVSRFFKDEYDREKRSLFFT